MSAKPNILLVTDWFSPAYKAGGPVRSVAAMIDLVGDEVSFEVLCRNTDWMEETTLNVQADQWIDKGSHRVKYLSKGYLKSVLGEVLKGKQRFIYFNGIYSPLFNALPLLFCLLISRKKVIVAPRGMLNPNAISLKSSKKRILLSLFKMLGFANKVVIHSASKKETNHVLEVFPNINPQRIREVHNVPAIPTNTDMAEAQRKSYLSVGRISRVKNSDFLIRVFKESDIETAQLELIGTTDDQEYYETCLKLVADDDRVQLVGGKDPQALQTHYKQSRFFCLATTGENFGHAIIEALAHGCPVLISDQTPWNHLAKAGAGWVIPLKDETAWKRAIRESKDLDPKKYLEMSAAAKQFVRDNFKIDELRVQYQQLFH